jgi:hypothetical protein
MEGLKLSEFVTFTAFYPDCWSVLPVLSLDRRIFDVEAIAF